MAIELICLDADDTLWHNMRFFAAAEEAFAAMLRPFADDAAAQARLAECEIRNLQLYGYGAKSFTLSMIETATELAGAAMPTAMLRDILAAGRTLMAHPVELFDDVDETLAALAARARLVLVTKGDLLHQESKLAASGLGQHFAGIEIVSDKHADTYRGVFARHGAAAARAIMAGDSMRSDILPALEAGAHAAFIPQPGGWAHEAAAPPQDHGRLHRLDRLAELPALIDRLG